MTEASDNGMTLEFRPVGLSICHRGRVHSAPISSDDLELLTSALAPGGEHWQMDGDMSALGEGPPVAFQDSTVIVDLVCDANGFQIDMRIGAKGAAEFWASNGDAMLARLAELEEAGEDTQAATLRLLIRTTLAMIGDPNYSNLDTAFREWMDATGRFGATAPAVLVVRSPSYLALAA